MPDRFAYATAFSRNIGWISVTEQAALRGKRIAIAGLGGVGGSHLLTLTRLGIGAFNLADFDSFELHNFNRQAGANLHTIGRPKLDVMADLARAINPELKLQLFPEGIGPDLLDIFLDGVDLYVDALDFFAVDIRRQVFAACHARHIPAITAAPLGMGSAVLTFVPGGMSFEEYFRLDGQPRDEQLARFLVGLSPAMLQRPYLVDPSAVDFNAARGPSTTMACELCAGLLATEALKLLLQRGRLTVAPHGLHFDAYRERLVRTWRPGGNRNPLQRLMLTFARRMLAAMRALPPSTPAPRLPAALDPRVARVLDLARWAPSGDNTQPWRFEARSPLVVVVHGFDTREHVVYDLRGRASQLALGGLLETVVIAASGQGLAVQVERHPDAPEERPTFTLSFQPDPAAKPDPLETAILARCTQRRPMRPTPLADRHKAALEAAVGPNYEVLWLDGFATKRRVAALLFRNAHVRLTTPEAYPTHRDIIEYGRQFSDDRIPDQAVGLDPVATRLMRWAMQSWVRVEFLNRWLAGTWLPRIQLDYVPAFACAAHFVIVARQPLHGIDDYLAGGRAMQRFWLTAARLGLQFQPEMTPLIFASYVRDGITFTATPRSRANAQRLSAEFEALVGAQNAAQAVFMGRVGFGPIPRARSTRLPLARLMTGTTPGTTA